MLPITDIIYNHEYAKRLYSGDENFEDVWRRIIGIGADFEKIHDEHIQRILKAIENYSGYTWEECAEDYFPIYIVEASPSIAHPFSLTVNEEPEEMLADFIYQLVHRNMYFGFTSQEIMEKSLLLVTDYVMKDLKLKEIEPSNWNLKEKTIKQYLKK